jgi:hypothetical protein
LFAFVWEVSLIRLESTSVRARPDHNAPASNFRQ